MKVVDFDGTVLDATFSVSLSEDDVSVVIESSGGHAGGPNPRNLEYRRGLSVLLRRLQVIGAVIEEIRVETERTRTLPLPEQRVKIEGRTFPVALISVDDVEELRKEISRYARKVGQSPELAMRSGGSSRRLRMILTAVPVEEGVLERRLTGSGVEAEADAVEAVVETAAGQSRRGGQGFLISHTARRAIQEHAESWATHYYRMQGWSVENVGATEPYDLHCVRDDEELHVEVKGTTTGGAKIILTPNEVTHSMEQHPRVELFVVSEIDLDIRDPDHPATSGGVARVWQSWTVDASRLAPVGFFYATGVDDVDMSPPWRLAPPSDGVSGGGGV